MCKVCNKLFTKGHLAVKHGAMSRCGAEESGEYSLLGCEYVNAESVGDTKVTRDEARYFG